MTARKFTKISISGFLGFPYNENAKELCTNGDIVILSGANGAGKSGFLEAISLLTTGESHRPAKELFHVGPTRETSPNKFKITVDDNLTLESRSKREFESLDRFDKFLKGWKTNQDDRKRDFATTYFHPEYLDRLFDESVDENHIGFADILAPQPRAISVFKKQLKEIRPKLRELIDDLQQKTGVMSASEKTDTRRTHADRMNKVFNGLNKLSLTDFPEYSDEIIMRYGNVRENWDERLYDYAQKIVDSKKHLKESIPLPEFPSSRETLQTFAQVVHLTTAESSSTIQKKQFPQQLAERLRKLPSEQWEKVKRLTFIQEHQKSVKMQADILTSEIDSIRRIRDEVADSGFIDSVKFLEEKSRNWNSVISDKKPNIYIPDSVNAWIEDANKLVAGWHDCQETWSHWITKLNDREKRLTTDLSSLKQELSVTNDTHSIIKYIEESSAKIPSLKTHLTQSSSAEEFLKYFENQITQIDPSIELAQNLIKECNAWAEFEDTVKRNEELEKTSNISQMFLLINDLREFEKAMATESGINLKAHLNIIQSKALIGEIPIIQDFITETATSFRMFEGLFPIRIELNRAKTKLQFKVGAPP